MPVLNVLIMRGTHDHKSTRAKPRRGAQSIVGGAGSKQRGAGSLQRGAERNTWRRATTVFFAIFQLSNLLYKDKYVHINIYMEFF